MTQSDQDAWQTKVREGTPQVIARAQIGPLRVARVELAGVPEFEVAVEGVVVRLQPAQVLRLVKTLCAFADIQG